MKLYRQYGGPICSMDDPNVADPIVRPLSKPTPGGVNDR